ncbi:PGAP1-like alpha/beta domain-containing protein [Calidifontibacter terrae]
MSGPERSGGAYSTDARLSDLRATAGALDRLGLDVRGCCTTFVRAMRDLPTTAAPFAPLQAAELGLTELRLGYGVDGLMSGAMGMEGLAAKLRWTATTYASTDQLQATSLRALQTVTAPARAFFVLGAMLQLGTFAAVPLPREADVVRDYFLPSRLRDQGGRAYAIVLASTLSLWPGTVDDLLLTVGAGMAACGGPSDLEHQAALVVLAARNARLLRDDRPLTVTPAPAHRPPATAPLQVADVIDDIGGLESPGASPDGQQSRVRVRRVTTPDGRSGWIVEIPGTQSWSPLSGHNPADLTANLAGTAALPSSLYPAIATALRQSMQRAGVRPGSEPVLLAGHSQGGIVATRMAQDPAFRHEFRVTHVVTAGSPVSGMTVPGSVVTLDLAHRSDLVPRLDRRDAPDSVNRYGITGDPAAPRSADKTDPIAVHGADRYADSAREWASAASTDPNVRWFYDSGPFFAGGREMSYDYYLQRPTS